MNQKTVIANYKISSQNRAAWHGNCSLSLSLSLSLVQTVSSFSLYPIFFLKKSLKKGRKAVRAGAVFVRAFFIFPDWGKVRS
jgi:hypothetical protein